MTYNWIANTGNTVYSYPMPIQGGVRMECEEMDQGTAEVIRDLATENGEFQQLEPGLIHACMSAKDGRIQALDLRGDEYLETPRRKKGTIVVRNVESFLFYYGKHKVNGQSEIYAEPDIVTVTGVLNAYASEQTDWRDHRVRLSLQHSPEWVAWTGNNKRLLPQVDFCEFLEEHIADVTKSTGGASAAALMEFATNFSAQRTLTFQSSARLSNGTTQFQYIENVDGQGGQKAGEAAMPAGFMLRIAPFVGADPVEMHARLRHRIVNRSLALQYLLDDPSGILRESMMGVMGKIAEETGDTVMTGSPSFM